MSENDVRLFEDPMLPDISDISIRKCTPIRRLAQPSGLHQRKRTRRQALYSDTESETNDQQDWLRESFSEIKTMISSLNKKVEQNEKCLREIQQSYSKCVD